MSIKLFVMDVDGTMTDGKIYILEIQEKLLNHLMLKMDMEYIVFYHVNKLFR